ncbi:uncharacterized protein F5Z01DRAFT_532937 [Emericellopsis atlantica]|uniref:Zn(2)-C6 fungal-type domain-containing protein n=1 Tax=Emericellopsis atlantica TaxID=2614577 RepID=A0A9P8CSQ9_9HYPO|nr:uncharacterized protein F5Z01DRAFT_532937 [Emericellopsis atlantica]KAG9256006.1 hypothetical protein F5Z01DRAFT_532937 [Emericellopsis atlantica]
MAPPRVSTACARCRRQKLKCDATKPCTMCVRSGAVCQPRQVHQSKSTSRQGEESRQRRRGQRVTPMSPQPSRTTASASGSQVSPNDRQTAPDSVESLPFGASSNRSAISLAMNMYQSLGTRAPTKDSAIPGTPAPPRVSVWTLRSIRMPPRSVMETLLCLYFEKMHWFIWIFHEPTFMAQAQAILSAESWTRQDMRKVVVTLTVAALGLKCALQNTSPQGRRLLASISSDPYNLVEQLVGEVRLHLLDLLDDACIETVQVTVLLGAFYIFHGSPSLAWSTIGMSVRTAYGSALHCVSEDEPEDSVATQVRRRCWNHVTVADTFASQIYGRPASIDPAFSALLPLTQMDDTVLPGLGDRSNGPVTALTFHWLKYKLYEIIRETISTFRLLRPRSPMSMQDLQGLIDAVQRIDRRLKDWTKSLPSPFDESNGVFNANDDQETETFASPCPRFFEPQSSSDAAAEDMDPALRQLRFQAWLLQDTYNAAVVLAHRPLLEYRLSADYRRTVLPQHVADLVHRSFDVSIKAALNISKTPVMQFEHEFCLAFIFIHLFTAGVMLCIPPTTHPHSSMAHEAKAGVFRIIQAAKALRSHSQVARHAEQLLSDLLKQSLYREVDLAFQEDNRPSEADPVMTDKASTHKSRGDTPVAPHTASAADTSHVFVQPPAAGSHGIAEAWTDETYLMNTDVSYLQPLDLPLDEAFGAFGQAMFNLAPDDSLNSWGWGRGFM